MSGVAADLYVGVGLAGAATPSELADLVDAALAGAGLDRANVAAVATVDHRAAHPAVLALGRPVVAFPAAVLVAVRRPAAPPVSPTSAAPAGPTARSGLAEPAGAPRGGSVGAAGAPAAARRAVAEPAALLAAGPGAVLVVAKRRSARATVAVARAGDRAAGVGAAGDRAAADRGTAGRAAGVQGVRA